MSSCFLFPLLLQNLIHSSGPAAATQRQLFAQMSIVDITMKLHLQKHDLEKEDRALLPAVPKPRAAVPVRRAHTSRLRKIKRATGPKARAQVEQTERTRWLKKLVGIVVEAKLPAVELARNAKDPDLRLKRMAGNRRSGTIRDRVRTWSRIRKWLLVVHGCCWPRSAHDFLDFLEVRMAEPCGSSIPKAALASLAFIEKAGSVPESERISCCPAVRTAVEDMTSEAALLSETKKKAPRPTAALMISLELCVMDQDQAAYWRALAWFKLIKIWASLRWNDTMGWMPNSTAMSSASLTAELAHTKTTGRDKRVQTLPLAVSTSCSLARTDWLRTGLDIWKSASFNSDRDYWLVLPADGMERATDIMAEYSDAMALSRKLLQSLCMPRLRDDGELTPGERPLFPEGAAGFYSEHGDRAWVTSTAAQLGVEKSRRDFCGRWGADKSDEYVRNAHAVITGVQDDIMQSIRQGQAVCEEDVAADFARHLHAKCSYESLGSASIAAQSLITPQWLWKWLQSETEVSMQRFPPVTEASQDTEFLPATGKPKPSETDLYWTLASRKKGCLTAHRISGCWRLPEMFEERRVAFMPEIPADMEVWSCKQCWPDGMPAILTAASSGDAEVLPDDMSVDSEAESSSTDSASTTDCEQ